MVKRKSYGYSSKPTSTKEDAQCFYCKSDCTHTTIEMESSGRTFCDIYCENAYRIGVQA